MKLPKPGTKVKLRLTIKKAEFDGILMQPLVRVGTVGTVTEISYPIRGGLPEPTVHVRFNNGYETRKPIESCVSGIPMAFSDWFEIV